MQDALRAYLELASGVTEASRKKAKKVAKDMMGKGGATAAQLQSFAEDLVSTSRKNREGLVRLVRYEVDRALGALGLATADEVNELTNRIRELERQVRENAAPTPPAGTAGTAGTAATGTSGPAKKSPARKAPARKTVAKKTTQTAAPAKTATAKTTGSKTTPAKKTATPAKAA